MDMETPPDQQNSFEIIPAGHAVPADPVHL